MLRVVSFLKFLSILLFLIILLLVYAYLPVVVQLEPESSDWKLDKGDFFYFTLAAFVVINIAMLGFQKLTEPLMKSVDLQAWFRGLPFVINLSLTFLIGFIGVINNSAHLSAEGFAYLNYLGPFLIFSWFIGFIILILKGSKTS